MTTPTSSPAPRFRVEAIDHVELFVPDREEAARWYGRALGLEVLESYRPWAEPEGGPLMISSDGGTTKLALFQGKPKGDRPTAGFHRVAFRVSARGFQDFLHHAATLGLEDAQGEPLTPAAAKDHGAAYSVYFKDPWGHPLEVTTYEAEGVRRWLGGRDSESSQDKEEPNPSPTEETGSRDSSQMPKTGAEIVEYWRRHGLIGSCKDPRDSRVIARELRRKAERRAWRDLEANEADETS